MSNPCSTCQPVESCAEGLDSYSLQDDLYLFVLNCPQGYYCGGKVARRISDFYNPNDEWDTIQMVCCDGNTYSTPSLRNLTPDQFNAAVQAVVEECYRHYQFCPDSDALPSAGPDADPQAPILYVSPSWNTRRTCPRGGTYYYTLRAGLFLGFNEEAVLLAAQRAADRQAAATQICLLDISSICVGSSTTVAVTGRNPAHAWSVTAGTLPPGLTVPTSWIPGNFMRFAGACTTEGTYTFTLRATSPSGTYCERSYTVCVVGMSPATLPDADKDQPYSQTLTAPACATAPLSWQVTAGALPDGLTLDEQTGVISGTPTVAGTFNFTVTLQTEAT